MIFRFLKQRKLFLVIVVECVPAFLLNIYLLKQMGAAFSDDHKIYDREKILAEKILFDTLSSI